MLGPSRKREPTPVDRALYTEHVETSKGVSRRGCARLPLLVLDVELPCPPRGKAVPLWSPEFWPGEEIGSSSSLWATCDQLKLSAGSFVSSSNCAPPCCDEAAVHSVGAGSVVGAPPDRDDGGPGRRLSTAMHRRHSPTPSGSSPEPKPLTLRACASPGAATSRPQPPGPSATSRAAIVAARPPPPATGQPPSLYAENRTR